MLSTCYTQTTWQHHHKVTIYTDTTAQTMFSVLPYVTEKLFDKLLVIKEQTPLQEKVFQQKENIQW